MNALIYGRVTDESGNPVDAADGGTLPVGLALDARGRLRLAPSSIGGGGGGGGGGASAQDIATEVDQALRASPLDVTISNPPSSPPSASAIASAIDSALRASALTVALNVPNVIIDNPPSNPPSAADIGNNLRGGAAIPVNILLGLGGSISISAEAASQRVQLANSGIVGVSITAVGADVYFNLGDNTVTASTASHYLPEGQSRDFRASPGQYIAVMRAGSTDGFLKITQLTA